MSLVGVQFLLENTVTVTYDDSPSNGSKLLDSESQHDTSLWDISAGPSITSTKIAVGKKATDYLVYEVPKKAKLTSVQVSMDSGFAETGEWLLK